jgi:prepilin-type processing-associated H-X9-DG protein
MGAALYIYTDDFDGFYPTMQNYAALSGKQGKSQIYGGKIRSEDRKLNAYLGSNSEISHCPADSGDVVWDTLFSNLCYDDYGTSYLPASFNNRGGVAYLFGRNQNLPSKNIHTIDKPMNKFVISDWPWGIARDAKHKETRWHGGDTSRILNILYADGHVTLVDFTLDYEVNKLNWKVNKNWLWW